MISTNTFVTYEVLPARSGAKTVRLDGRFLHSRYDPVREARRLADRYSPPSSAKTLFVLGEGIPYFSEAIALRNPSCTVIAFTIGSVKEPNLSAPNIVHHAFPDLSPGTIRRLVRSYIRPLSVGRVDAQVWPQAEGVTPEWVTAVHRELLAGLEDVRSQLATSASFGRLWIKNALRRTIGAEWRQEATIAGERIRIVAGGPSIEKGFPYRLHGGIGLSDSPPVIAASSAMSALVHRGISPRLLVHTDAGFWAQRYRSHIDYKIPTAISLRASLKPGSPVADDNDILLRHGWFGEELAPDAETWQPVPESPTVSGTMLALISSIAPERTILELHGFDLCSYDLLTHGRPHSNDRFIERSSSRLSPSLTIQAARSGALLSSGTLLHWRDGTPAYQSASLQAYQEPLQHQVRRIGRTRKIEIPFPSPVWNNAGIGSSDSGIHSGTGSITLKTIRRPPKKDRIDHAMGVLTRWRRLLHSSESDTREDVLLHIAPVESLQAIRSDGTWSIAIETADRWISSLIQRVGTMGNGT